MFSDKIAIVTGGGSGIGRALCTELGRRGAAVLVADLDRNRAEKVAAQIVAEGGRATGEGVDVAVEEHVRHLVDAAVSRHGRLDYLFNNAGIAIGGDVRDLTLEQWNKVFAVNWYGVLHGTRIAYPRMAKQGSGHIINVSSLTGLLPQPFNAPYCASKHAVVGLSLALRYEGADLGVKVSVVCPGHVRTDIFNSSKMVNVPNEKLARLRPTEGISADTAAQYIVRGVEANRDIIAFPWRERWIWRLYRLFPAGVGWLIANRASQYRHLRDEALQESGSSRVAG
jgi:NAD(P)-dependent dehydrogenase (short-subunit alcohol dehydrogenase family)